MVLFGLLALPFLIGSVGFLMLRRTVTWKEYLAYTLISVAFAVAGYWLALQRAVDDVEHIHGRLAKQAVERVDCCHCLPKCKRRGAGGICWKWGSDCRHSSDNAYRLYIDTGGLEPYALTLSACAQRAPTGWSSVREGEPATIEHHYKNYLKADPYSLLRERGDLEAFVDRVPARPRVTAHYHLKNAIGVDVALPFDWNERLGQINAELGPTNQVDVIVVVVDEPDPRFADALAAKWLLGPKNAVTVVMGVEKNDDDFWRHNGDLREKLERLERQIADAQAAGDNDGADEAAAELQALREDIAAMELDWRWSDITWARAISLSEVSVIDHDLRAALPDTPLRDRDILTTIQRSVGDNFERLPMELLMYLANSVRLTPLATGLLYAGNLLVICGLLWLAHRHDPLGDGPSKLRARIGERLNRFWPWRVARFAVLLAFEVLRLGVRLLVGLARLIWPLIRAKPRDGA